MGAVAEEAPETTPKEAVEEPVEAQAVTVEPMETTMGTVDAVRFGTMVAMLKEVREPITTVPTVQEETGEILPPLETVARGVKADIAQEVTNKDKGVPAAAGAAAEAVVVLMLRTETQDQEEKEAGRYARIQVQLLGMEGTTQHRSKDGCSSSITYRRTDSRFYNDA